MESSISHANHMFRGPKILVIVFTVTMMIIVSLLTALIIFVGVTGYT